MKMQTGVEDLTVPIYSDFLEESIAIAQKLPEAEGYLARSNFKLAQVYAETGETERSQICKEVAESLRAKISGETKTPSESAATAYDRLVPWMLW